MTAISALVLVACATIWLGVICWIFPKIVPRRTGRVRAVGFVLWCGLCVALPYGLMVFLLAILAGDALTEIDVESALFRFGVVSAMLPFFGALGYSIFLRYFAAGKPEGVTGV